MKNRINKNLPLQSRRNNMKFTNTDQELQSLLKSNLNEAQTSWLQAKIDTIINTESAKELYLTYSLLASKVDKTKVLAIEVQNEALADYLNEQHADTLEVARIYLLSIVLIENSNYFQSKVANLIQVADSGELVTFLKYLILLPDAENYKHVAVEALRTNISTVFEAISMKNPYPSQYFNDQEWNQMYLKATFMQLDLSNILEVDKRANKDLTRIISDYAHERWAASRDIDPLFWRPVSGFLNDTLLIDMERLLNSDNAAENIVGALCCYNSDRTEAKELLKKYPKLYEQVVNQKVTWENIKN